MKNYFRITQRALWGRVAPVLLLVVIAAFGVQHFTVHAATSGVTVSGNQLMKDGQPFVPRGFTMIGLLTPPGCSQATGQTAYSHLDQNEMDVMKNIWKANTVRFQISHNGLSAYTAAQETDYLNRIIAGVQLARSNGFVVILSLQDQSTGCGPARPLPTQESPTIWTTLANSFKNDPNIMFELWNEPNNKPNTTQLATTDPAYSSTYAWPDWLNGRSTAITNAAATSNWSPYVPFGHQQLIDAVRATGATNVVIADGSQYAENLTSIPMLTDSLQPEQIAYAVHPYYFETSASDWDTRFGNLTATKPVIATEWTVNCGNKAQEGMTQQFLDYLKNKSVGMTAWSLDIINALISDWNYTPTSPTNCVSGTSEGGDVVKNYFTSYPVTPPPDTTPPTAAITSPTNNASVQGTTTVTATASDNVGVASVNLYVDNVSVASATTAPYSFIFDTTPYANGPHSLVLKAVDGANNVGSSSPVSVNINNPDTLPPTVPVGLSSPSQSASSINLSWTASTDNVGVASYIIQRNGVQIGTATSTTYTDATVAPGTAYSYSIAAVDAAGNTSNFSGPLVVNSAPAPDTTPPSTPTNIIAQAISANNVNLSWTASTDNVGVAGYYIQRDGVTLAQVTSTSYTDPTVAAATTYTYGVVAYDSAQNNSGAASATVLTPAPPDITPPSSPTNFKLTLTATQANLSWTASTDNVGVKQYTVYRNNAVLTTTLATSIGDATITPGSTYNYQVTAQDGSGNTSAMSATVVATIPSSRRILSKGLSASYYKNTTLSGTALNRIDSTVNFSWGLGSPDPSITADNFSARWTGKLSVPTTGSYTLFTRSDDGVRLYVDNRLVINDWTVHSLTEHSTTITLTKGTTYNIRLEYFESTGSSSMVFLWSGPGIIKQVIPSTYLSTSSNGLRGNYFKDAILSAAQLTRIDAGINFNWGTGSPDATIPVDNFSVRWSGWITPPTDATYTLYTQTDNGARLWVNNMQLVNAWTDTANYENSGSIQLNGGVSYPVTLEYYEKTGSAQAHLLWSSSTVTKQIIPKTNLADR